MAMIAADLRVLREIARNGYRQLGWVECIVIVDRLVYGGVGEDVRS